MVKIGVISPYLAFTESVKTIASKLNIDISIREGALQRGLHYANQLIQEENVNVIVARGATADLLQNKLEIPVIKINVTNFDILKACQQAKNDSEIIIFIDQIENENKYELKSIEEILQLNITLKQYRDEAEILNHIKDVALNYENGVIVGTAECMSRSATNLGVKLLIINSTNEAIQEALVRARDTAFIYEREKLRQKHLETIISYAFDGVIATDTEGDITVFNDIAVEITGIKSNEVLNRKLSKIQYPFLKKLYGDGGAATKKVITFGNNKYVVNRIPIINNPNSLVITFQETTKVLQADSRLRSELYTRRFYAKYSFEDIVYQSEIMGDTIELAKKYSQADSTVLINGETGTGKELFAQSIHNASQRRNGPFIAINCAALPESLLESELFGYEEGAFTGAKKGGKPGLFEMAHEGTLFLDEIGELPISLQARLLRVLQEQEVMRIGGERIIPINVRVICATNKDLKKSAIENKFRLDLYYRLNILHIKLPPLRERKEDIISLVHQMLEERKAKFIKLNNRLIKILLEHNWLGNVRELENVVERMIAFGDNLPIEKFAQLIIQDPLLTEVNNSKFEIEPGSLKEIEEQVILQLDKRFNGNKQELAQFLGISRTTLWKKMKELELID